MSGEPWEVRSKRTLEGLYGSAMYPRRLADGTYSPGIGHTGDAWPRGTGHDYCWQPWNCISCGCGPKGPCNSHRNIAMIAGYDPTLPKAPNSA